MRVKQIENAFNLMDFFVSAQKPLTHRDIVTEFGWPRSSTFNIVSTLVELGYLYQIAPRSGFAPTNKWMDLAKGLSDSQPLPEEIQTLLIEIMMETGETVLLAGPEGTNAVFLDVIESTAPIKFTASIGERVPIHITSLGRAILAQYTPAERLPLLRKVRYNEFEGGPFMSLEAVEDNIRKGKKIGWFSNIAELEGLAGIGVPFPYQNRRLAIAMGAPVARVKKRVKELGEYLCDTVQKFCDEHDF